MNRSSRLARALVLLALGAGTAFAAGAQTPQITGLSTATLERSGRLLVFGSAFGADQGTSSVAIDGLPAIVTTWSDTEIHAYVPEGAALALDPVEVTTSGGTSNTELLQVSPRTSEGRFRWRFQFDSPYAGTYSAVGPNGTVYASDNRYLYALSQDGALLWVLADVGEGRPITFGAEGTLYTGGNEVVGGDPNGSDVAAVNPDGTLRWRYNLPTGDRWLLVGPGVGPDGNIYAVQNTLNNGNGAFALDSDGNLLWTQPGPADFSGNNYKLLFTADRFIAPYAGNHIAYDFDGNILWDAGEMGLNQGSLAQLDPSDRLILQWGLIGAQAWSQDAEVQWIADPEGALGNLVPPTPGPDGTIYSGTWAGGDLWAINPDGTTRWLLENEIDGFLMWMKVSPDGAVLIDSGAPDFGQPSFIRGFDTETGALLWVQSFHVENDLNEFAHWIEPAFTADNRTAIVQTRFSSSTQSGWLYAVDISTDGGETFFADSFESGDLQAWSTVVQ